ncbi:hypothetical protein Slala02_69060 [Streptomyces lavendulae subsp. lavendulae]|nr:hypothetical protein Slala01_30840 [Streptomyces lavendulae subsp. lavendulae]GLX31086.1 hypothetical protein Slala02_69060 [Streptomyces lavendulae subsp. lavendulae]
MGGIPSDGRMAGLGVSRQSHRPSVSCRPVKGAPSSRRFAMSLRSTLDRPTRPGKPKDCRETPKGTVTGQRTRDGSVSDERGTGPRPAGHPGPQKSRFGAGGATTRTKDRPEQPREPVDATDRYALPSSQRPATVRG